jgi:hypothetical protein
MPRGGPGRQSRTRRTCENHPALSRKLAPDASHVSLFRELLVNLALRRLDPEVPMISITSFNEWHTLQFLFNRGPAPPPPFPGCGAAQPGRLGCESFPPCGR